MSLILRNLVIYQVPKTGTTWIEHALQKAKVPFERHVMEGLGKHETIHDFKVEGKMTFACVRHPVTWYPSYWEYQVRTNWKHENRLSKTCRDDDFNQFIRNVTQKARGYLSDDLFDGYIGNPKVVDIVGRQENLCEDLIKALKVSGEVFDEEKIRRVPHINAAQLGPIQYEPGLKEEILKGEERAIHRFYSGDEVKDILREGSSNGE